MGPIRIIWQRTTTRPPGSIAVSRRLLATQGRASARNAEQRYQRGAVERAVTENPTACKKPGRPLPVNQWQAIRTFAELDQLPQGAQATAFDAGAVPSAITFRTGNSSTISWRFSSVSKGGSRQGVFKTSSNRELRWCLREAASLQASGAEVPVSTACPTFDGGTAYVPRKPPSRSVAGIRLRGSGHAYRRIGSAPRTLRSYRH